MTLLINKNIELAVQQEAIVAESPIWSAREQVLYWLDIGQNILNCFAPKTAITMQYQLLVNVSAIVFDQHGNLLLLTHHGLASFDRASENLEYLVADYHLGPNYRFNDAKVDGTGRLWAGSMRKDLSSASAKMYCLEQNSLLEKVSNLTVANGLAWSPDQQTFYLVETITRVIYAFDYIAETGALNNQRVLIRFTEAQGKPDGLTVDNMGNIWVAMWDGWSVLCFSSAGELLELINLPVPRPTSVAFGGVNNATLYITSASYGLTPEQLQQAPYSGSLLACQTTVSGQANHLYQR